jgi:beta-lactamase superfamily II metal-dependent hydrolase
LFFIFFFISPPSRGEVCFYILNVGHGNFIIVKNHASNNVLIVDAGTKVPTMVIGKRNFITSLDSLLSADPPAPPSVTVVITHAHFDHYNLLGEVYRRVPVERVLVGSSKNTLPDDFPLFPPPPTVVDRPSAIPPNSISTCLGSGVDVQLVLPTKWPNITDPNSCNIVVKVTYARRSVLLTGDATGELLQAIDRKVRNRGWCQDVSFVVYPHHGSMLHGGFEWRQRFPYAPIVISAGPEDSISMPQLEAGYEETVIPHPVKLNSYGTAPSATTTKPIFITAFAQRGYYKITIQNDGQLTLTDGDISEPAPLLRLTDGDTSKPKPLRLLPPRAADDDVFKIKPEGKPKGARPRREPVGFPPGLMPASGPSFSFPSSSFSFPSPSSSVPPPGGPEKPVVIGGYSFRLIDVPRDGNCAVWAAMLAAGYTLDERGPSLMEDIRRQAAEQMPAGGVDVLQILGKVLGLKIVVYNAEKCEFYQAFGDRVDCAMTSEEALNPHYTLFYYSDEHYQLMIPCR